MNNIGLEVDNNMELINKSLEQTQNMFLETTLGKVINSAIDVGLKAVLPDLIENEIIDIKDTLLTNGFSEGIGEVINTAINTGKSAIGVFTGNFENVSQIEMAVKKGGMLDKVSKLLDFAINLASSKNLISKDISSLIKSGKNTIITSMADKIEKTLTTQIKAIEKIETYCNKWNDAFLNKDISKMEISIKNIEKGLEKTIPFENIIKEARKIEVLHNIIKATGNFEISDETIELAQRLN